MTAIEKVNNKHQCIVIQAYYPLAQPRVERETMALVERGFEVDLICLRDEGEQAFEVVKGVNVYRLPMKRYRGHGPVFQLLEYLAFFVLVLVKLFLLHRRRDYGAVQVHNLPDFLVFAAIWPKLKGARIILNLRDLMPDFFAARFGTTMDSWPVRLLLLQERVACRFADDVITVTELWRQMLIARGIPAEKVTVIMNVPDERYFHRSLQEQQPAGRNGHFNLIYHGSLTQRYGVDLAIQAVDHVRDEIPDVRLSILGAGDHRDELIDLVNKKKLTDHVVFSAGFVPTAQLPDLIRQADIGIVANRDDLFTGALLPTKLLEYSALGVPAIAARTPAIADYFDDTMVAFFKPGDANDLAECIRALYADELRRDELVCNSARFTERYNWSTVSKEYVGLVGGAGVAQASPGG